MFLSGCSAGERWESKTVIFTDGRGYAVVHYEVVGTGSGRRDEGKRALPLARRKFGPKWRVAERVPEGAWLTGRVWERTYDHVSDSLEDCDPGYLRFWVTDGRRAGLLRIRVRGPLHQFETPSDEAIRELFGDGWRHVVRALMDPQHPVDKGTVRAARIAGTVVEIELPRTA
jgi:hypothetical protein